MSTYLTRRGALTGALAALGTTALADAPLRAPRPQPRGVAAPVVLRPPLTDALVADARLGGTVGFVLADAETGEIVAERNAAVALPPASTLKSITALYALERLGPGHTFSTEVLALGDITPEGALEGDLALVSDGDPTLDTDRLNLLAKQLAEAGVKYITGDFLVWTGALPNVDRIEPGQPEHVGYNPAVGGINLNFNRVHFTWTRGGDGYETSMVARGETAAPTTRVATISVVDRKGPVYGYVPGPGVDRWSVARGALGKGGSRWLPVRNPGRYAGDVFRELARGAGVRLPAPVMAEDRPEGQRLARTSGPVLTSLLQGMLRYSTNLTAEVAGLSASVAEGDKVDSLAASGGRMARWAMGRYGLVSPTFRDHSGLGYGSKITPDDMVRALSGGRDSGLRGILKPVNLALDKGNPAPAGVSVVAKTGTLNFVSALAGYINDGGRDRVFAILTADTARRDAVPLESRDRPDGGRAWAGRSRLLQKQLLRAWSTAPA